eukprot:Rmarinus@m.27629
MDEVGLDEEEFGQRVDLTQRIREVLQNYPDTAALIKELIQNADDAKATEICICLDHRTHGANKLAFPDTNIFQGPALLVYNDAVFTDDDFEGIRNVGDSQKVNKPHKTGRFGIGFNSVYHMTDLPSFVSRNRLAFFDPHCKYLRAQPGTILDFVRQKLFQRFKDQAVPYIAFGCNMVDPFNGTLFRLPLREPEQASRSRICSHAFSTKLVRQCLNEFERNVAGTLLFLKYVATVKVLEWEEGMDKPHQLYGVTVDNASDVATQRNLLERLLAENRIST